MTHQLWINLPIKDANRTREFFTKVGFTLNENYGNSENAASFLVGTQKVIVMFFAEDTFKSFTKCDVPDLSNAAQAMFSFDAESKEEVDAYAQRVREAGGTIFGEPAEMDGWMYGFAFIDLDGHRWNALYMDMSKLPQ